MRQFFQNFGAVGTIICSYCRFLPKMPFLRKGFPRSASQPSYYILDPYNIKLLGNIFAHEENDGNDTL